MRISLYNGPSRAMGLVCALLLLLCTAVAPSEGANTHNVPTMQQESQAWFGDALSPYIALGCAPIVPSPASLTFAAFACNGYVRGSGGDLVYVTQAAAAVGPLNAGDGTYWLALHRDVTTTISAWTRQAGTHYLWQLGATQPANPAGGQVFAKGTVVGNVITAVDWLANSFPIRPSTILGSYNVKEFGARCDGVTDDSGALNRAILAAGPKGTVIIPACNNFYALKSAWSITAEGITVLGSGKQSMIVATGTNNAIEITSGSGIRIENLAVGTVTGAGHGIVIGSVAQPAHRGTLSNIYCRSAGGSGVNNCIELVRGILWTIYSPRLTGNESNPFTFPGSDVIAKNGIHIQGNGLNNSMSIFGPVIEGFFNHGIDVDAGGVETLYIYGGSIEANGNRSGLATDANIRFNGTGQLIVDGTYMEITDGGGNLHRQIILSGSTGSVIRGATVGAIGQVGGSLRGAIELINCKNTLLENLRADGIFIDAASTYTTLQGVSYGNNGGSITNNGIKTTLINISNASSAGQQAAGIINVSNANFATNASFEQWDSPSTLPSWAALNSTLAMADSLYDGNRALFVTGVGGVLTGQGVVYQGAQPDYAKLAGKKSITITAWMRVTGTTLGKSIAILYDGGASVQAFGITGLSATWQKVSTTFPILNGFTNYAIHFRVSNNGVGTDSNLYLDGVTMTWGDVQPYEDVNAFKPELSQNGHHVISFAAQISIASDTVSSVAITLTGNVTSIILVPGVRGKAVWIRFTQNSVGGWGVTGWPGTVKWVGASPPTITVGANKSDLLCLLFDGTSWWECGRFQNQS